MCAGRQGDAGQKKRETGSHPKVSYPLPKAKKDTGFNGFSKTTFF